MKKVMKLATISALSFGILLGGFHIKASADPGTVGNSPSKFEQPADSSFNIAAHRDPGTVGN